MFAVRYVNGGAFDGGTSLLTWRDAKRNITKFNCALGFPAPFPLGQNQVVVFDEEENFETPEGCTISPCPTEEGLIPFPFEAQRTDVGSSALPSSYDFGWIFLNLNSAVAGSLVPFEPLMQNWVSVVMDAQGRFSVGFDAIQLGNVTDPRHRAGARSSDRLRASRSRVAFDLSPRSAGGIRARPSSDGEAGPLPFGRLRSRSCGDVGIPLSPGYDRCSLLARVFEEQGESDEECIDAVLARRSGDAGFRRHRDCG